MNVVVARPFYDHKITHLILESSNFLKLLGLDEVEISKNWISFFSFARIYFLSSFSSVPVPNSRNLKFTFTFSCFLHFLRCASSHFCSLGLSTNFARVFIQLFRVRQLKRTKLIMGN